MGSSTENIVLVMRLIGRRRADRRGGDGGNVDTWKRGRSGTLFPWTTDDRRRTRTDRNTAATQHQHSSGMTRRHPTRTRLMVMDRKIASTQHGGEGGPARVVMDRNTAGTQRWNGTAAPTRPGRRRSSSEEEEIDDGFMHPSLCSAQCAAEGTRGELSTSCV